LFGAYCIGSMTTLLDGARYGRMQDFRQLLVWKRAHAFALNVRRVVETLPRTGYTDLKSQMTRASQSIVDNIVEGCGAASPRSSRLSMARWFSRTGRVSGRT
jgi:hypothetical protein